MPARPTRAPEPPTPLDRLLTAPELAELLGVSEDTVRTWTRRGDVPAIHLTPRGGVRHRVRYRESDIRAWIDSQPKAGL